LKKAGCFAIGGQKMEKRTRTFKQLQKEKTLEELNHFAKEVTELYARSVIEYTQSKVARDNKLTITGLRDLMDYAIVTAVVTRETANLILAKAMENQRRKRQDAGASSLEHYQKLIKEREDYLAQFFSRVEVKKITEHIANAPSMSISYFTKAYKIESDRLTKLLLKRAIVEGIVSDEVMKEIIRRSLRNNKTEATIQYFENLRKAREEYKTHPC